MKRFYAGAAGKTSDRIFSLANPLSPGLCGIIRPKAKGEHSPGTMPADGARRRLY
jgi:hypothetical protein